MHIINMHFLQFTKIKIQMLTNLCKSFNILYIFMHQKVKGRIRFQKWFQSFVILDKVNIYIVTISSKYLSELLKMLRKQTRLETEKYFYHTCQFLFDSFSIHSHDLKYTSRGFIPKKKCIQHIKDFISMPQKKIYFAFLTYSEFWNFLKYLKCI